MIADWRERLERADELLLAGRPARARSIVDRVLAEMCDRIESGPAASLLAMSALLRGLSEAGAESERDAIWDFHIALALEPGFAQVDLGRYGPPGALLDGHRVVEEPPEPDRASSNTTMLEPPRFRPPRKWQSPAPKYPAARQLACLEGAVEVGVTIDEEGVPHSPRLRSQSSPVLAFAALDVLRDWRFRPAVLEGRPVEVFYNLKVNWLLPGACPGRGR